MKNNRVARVGLFSAIGARSVHAHGIGPRLAIDADLIDGEAYPDPGKKGGGIFVINKPTWAGHDFLNAAHIDNVWNSSKRRIAKVGSWRFGFVLEVLKEEAKRQIGL